MVFVLMALVLIGVITLSVLQLIAAEIGGSIRDLQSGQVFNIAQAGVHHAIGRLQLAGAPSYPGETLRVISGETTLGTATIIVNCPDTGTPPPCSGPYAGYRRIISTGTLPTRGPTRTIVAVVQATTGAPKGICAYEGGVDIGATTVYSDVGSNAAIILAGGSPQLQIRADPKAPQQFTGTAVAMGNIACGSSCAAQVQGRVLPGQSAKVCPAIIPPSYTRGVANLYVDRRGFTMNAGTGYSWNDVRLTPASCSGPSPFTDLNIETDPSNPRVTTVAQINTLVMGNCSRIVILGVGRLELRIAEPTYNSLAAFANTRFGVLPSDSVTTPAPVPASRFVVWVNSNGSASAVTSAQFLDARLVAGTIMAPNGRLYATGAQMMAGALWAKMVSIHAGGSFSSDVSGLPAEATGGHADFKQLKSWKDQ